MPDHQTLDSVQNSLRSLIEAFVITLRPWDLMHEPLNALDISKNVANFHFQQAYTLLTEISLRKEWINHFSCKEIPFAMLLKNNLTPAHHLDDRKIIYTQDNFPSATEIIDRSIKEIRAQ